MSEANTLYLYFKAKTSYVKKIETINYLIINYY